MLLSFLPGRASEYKLVPNSIKTVYKNDNRKSRTKSIQHVKLVVDSKIDGDLCSVYV